MDEIPKVCRLMMSGIQVSQEQERALRLFMSLPDNAEVIMRAATKQSSILLCYRTFTRQTRRSGEYFRSRQDPQRSRKMILMMLQILQGISQYPAKQQNNAYLCLEGQLLAQLIDLQQNPQIITNYLILNIWQKKVCDEIKVHCLLKIMVSCLDQLQEIRDKYTPRCQLRYKILSFITKYGFIFIPIITMLTQTIYNNLRQFICIDENILNLQQVQDSFLNVMGQGEPTQVLGLQNQTKPYVMQWEIIHLVSWIKFYCFYLKEMVNAIQGGCHNGNAYWKDMNKISVLLCRAVTLSTHIYELSIWHVNENVGSKFKENVQEFILKEFVIPYLEGFANQQVINCNDGFKLTAEFHVAVLRLLLTGEDLLQFYLQSFPFSTQIEESKQIKLLKNYCNYVITNNYFYFIQFDQCPIGLSIRLINNIKKEVLKMIQKNKKNEKYNNQFKKYQKQLNKIHQLFFQNFIVFKLLLNTQITCQNQEIYSEGKNWQQFINTTLNCYFSDLVKEGPKYFSDEQLVQDSVNSLFPDDDSEYEDNTESNIIAEKSRKKKKFEKDSGFQLFSRMISSISFGNLNQIGITAPKKQKQGNDDDIDDDDDPNEEDQKQQSIIFAQMLSILACFKALINSSINSQKRAHLFFQFYEICHEINIPNFSNSCRLKARLCKLYIIHSFINQCLTQNFVQQGQNSSNTFIYISKQCGIDLQQFILQASDGIGQCLEKLSIDEDDDVQIIKYGLAMLQDLSRKLADRIYFVSDDVENKGKNIKQKYSKIIDMIFATILQLDMISCVCFEKMYSVAGILIDLCGIKSLYEIYTKLVDDTICLNKQGLYPQNLDLYLAGIAGLLSGINRQDIFRVAAEVILEDLLVIKEKNVLILSENDDRFQYFLSLANQLTSLKLYTDTQNRLALLSTDLLYDILVRHLEEGLSTPCYEKISKQLYIKMAKFETINYLIPLPKNISMHAYPQILEQYFSSVNRLQNLASIEQFASLKVQWLTNYLQAKIQRDEAVTINIEEVAVNIRFDRTTKIQRLASLLNIVTGVSSQNIIHRIQQSFKEADKIFFHHQINFIS